jgi:hypothetical protein
VKVVVYVEGGGNADLDSKCREGFRNLFEKAEIKVRFVACGGRNSAFDRFNTHALNLTKVEGFPILLVDSEDPISGAFWEHVTKRDGWVQPVGTTDEQILFMATCMETWMITDSSSTAAFFGKDFQKSALPAATNLETRLRHQMFDALEKSTRKCTKKYEKGRISFQLLGELKPSALTSLSHWNRCVQILGEALAS